MIIELVNIYYMTALDESQKKVPLVGNKSVRKKEEKWEINWRGNMVKE